MDIGRKIYFFRTKKGLTQEELAQEICSVSYLSKMENDKINPSPEILSLLSNKLGISIEKKTYNQDTDNHVENDKTKKLIEEWFEVIKSRGKDKAIEMKKNIYEAVNKIDEPELINNYLIFNLRFQLLLRNLE